MNIPLISTPDKPIISTTQNHLPIADITEDLILLKGGGAALVLESTALNFSLLSEREQEAVVAAYSAFLNSLSFPVQVLVRSQKKDISTYISFLDDYSKKIQNPKLSKLMESYKNFLQETVKKKNVLGKRFFIIIPFSPLEIGISARSFVGLVKPNSKVPYPKSYVIKKAKISLYPKRDHLIRQAGRVGLKLRQLASEEITELFHEVYNPPVSSITRPKEVLEQNTSEGRRDDGAN